MRAIRASRCSSPIIVSTRSKARCWPRAATPIPETRSASSSRCDSWARARASGPGSKAADLAALLRDLPVADSEAADLGKTRPTKLSQSPQHRNQPNCGGPRSARAGHDKLFELRRRLQLEIDHGTNEFRYLLAGRGIV